MTFRVATRVAPPAEVLVLDFHNDLRACRDRLRVVLISVFDNDVGALRYGTACITRGFLELTEVVVVPGAHHDHAVAEQELRMSDRLVLARYYEVFLESECLSEPLDGRAGVVVCNRRNYACRCVLRVVRHFTRLLPSVHALADASIRERLRIAPEVIRGNI